MTVAITAISSVETSSGDLERIRGSQIQFKLGTRILLNSLGRDRALKEFANIRSNVDSSVFARLRKRPGCGVSAVSSLETLGLIIFPNPEPPTCEILVGTSKLNKLRLIAGDTHILNFTFTGKRLNDLELSFTASTLGGESKIIKSSDTVPGGIFVDSSIPHVDGQQTIVGYIALLPSETEKEDKELELKYELVASNQATSRNYVIESGFFTIYQP